MAKRKKPKIIYTNLINLSGLFHHEPVRCTWSSEYECWLSDNEDYDLEVSELKETRINNVIQYSSEDRSDVLLWTDGALAMLDAIKRLDPR